MSTARAALIWCPFASIEEARGAARVLLEERLVACANIVPGVISLYRWQGRIEEAGEAVLLAKTQAPLLEAAVNRLAQLHPYDTPAILGWDAAEAPPATLAWLQAALV